MSSEMHPLLDKWSFSPTVNSLKRELVAAGYRILEQVIRMVEVPRLVGPRHFACRKAIPEIGEPILGAFHIIKILSPRFLQHVEPMNATSGV